MRTPSASSTSADPHNELAARLPCLAILTPAPAATKAAVVEMLKVPSESPPVPTTSTSVPSMGALDSDGGAAHAVGQPGYFVGGLPFYPKTHEEGGDPHLVDLSTDQLVQDPAGFLRA